MRAHATQITVDGPFFALSNNLGQEVLGHRVLPPRPRRARPGRRRAATAGRTTCSPVSTDEPTGPVRLVGWALAAVVVAGWLALVEVFWLPLRVGGVLVPVSRAWPPSVGNLLLPRRGAAGCPGSRLVAVLPAVAWLVVASAA